MALMLLRFPNELSKCVATSPRSYKRDQTTLASTEVYWHQLGEPSAGCASGLAAQAVNDCAEFLQVPIMVAISARLRRAATSTRNCVPACCASQGYGIRAAHARIAKHHSPWNRRIVQPDQATTGRGSCDRR